MLSLFINDRHTFKRIIRNGSTEEFSGLPYIYALLNCMISMWYGSPLISSDNMLILSVNSVGAVFQLAYITLFIVYAEKPKKVRNLLNCSLGTLMKLLKAFYVLICH